MTAMPVQILPRAVREFTPQPGERVYFADVDGAAGCPLEWKVRIVVSHARVREVACRLFRQYFGSPCTFSWGSNGFMAEAWDDRGHRVTLSQINDSHG